MSAGVTRVAALDIAESAADVPTDPGVTRLRRNAGAIQQAIAGGSWSQIAGGSDTWAAARIAEFQMLFPTLALTIRFAPAIKPILLVPPSSAAAGAGVAALLPVRGLNIIGGSVSPAAGQYMPLTGIIATDLTTQPYAWFARGKFSAISANFQQMGPIDTTGANYVNPVALNTYDATKLCLQLFKTGAAGNGTVIPTSHTIDGNRHNYGGVGDGTTHYAIVDGAIVGQTSVLTNLTSGNRFWGAFNATGGDLQVDDLMIGYQQP